MSSQDGLSMGAQCAKLQKDRYVVAAHGLEDENEVENESSDPHSSRPVVPRLHVDRICEHRHQQAGHGKFGGEHANEGDAVESRRAQLGPITAYTPRPESRSEASIRAYEKEAEEDLATLYAPETQRRTHRAVLAGLHASKPPQQALRAALPAVQCSSIPAA